MLWSKVFLPTLKDTPQDAEVISHQLMLRAGMIRKVTSGIYNWLPLGLRVLKKIENIVREEMDASGAQEVLMPMVQPKELWEETQRWKKMGPELLRIQDRHERDFCLGPTHEEVITDLVRNNVKSYKELPLSELMKSLEPEDLIKYGLIPEFIGRMPIIATLDELNESSLIKILKEPKNSLIKQYKRLFEFENVELEFQEEAVLEIAKKAIKKRR